MIRFGGISLIVCTVFLCFCSFSQNRDSLWQAWKNPKVSDSLRINALDHLCFLLAGESKYDSVQLLADVSYQFAKQRHLRKQAVRALLRKADAYCEADKTNTKASDVYQQCYVLAKEANYDRGMGVALNNLGTIYLNWGDYSKAIHYYYEGLKAMERLGEASYRATALVNIAKIYSHNGHFDSAISIAKRALPDAAQENKMYASLLKNVGTIYREHQDYDSAQRYLEMSAALAKKIKDPFNLRHTYLELALNYMDVNDLPKSRLFLKNSRQLHEQFSDSVYIGKCMAAQALLNYREGKLNTAISEAEASLPVLAKDIHKHDQLQMMATLSEWYKKKGNFKRAFQLQASYSHLKDSLGTTDAQNALILEQLKYTSEKRTLLEKAETERRVARLREEAEKKDFKKTLWLIGISCTLLLLSLLTWFGFRYYQQKTIIASQKNKLMKQQLLVAQMNPHFIFNSLNAIQNFIYKQDSYQAGIYLKQFSELIRMILHFSTKEVISLEEEYQFLKNYLNLQQLRFNGRFNYQLTIDPNLERDLILIPPMMAQPFIENAIEHGLANKREGEEGFLWISLKMEGKNLLYEIEDNGVGLKEAFRLQQELGKKHQSLAISITKERLKEMSEERLSGFDIEIKDKSLSDASTTGVYVKFVTPFLAL